MTTCNLNWSYKAAKTNVSATLVPLSHIGTMLEHISMVTVSPKLGPTLYLRGTGLFFFQCKSISPVTTAGIKLPILLLNFISFRLKGTRNLK
jgi:hypothetical protein